MKSVNLVIVIAPKFYLLLFVRDCRPQINIYQNIKFSYLNKILYFRFSEFQKPKKIFLGKKQKITLNKLIAIENLPKLFL